MFCRYYRWSCPKEKQEAFLKLLRDAIDETAQQNASCLEKSTLFSPKEEPGVFCLLTQWRSDCSWRIFDERLQNVPEIGKPQMQETWRELEADAAQLDRELDGSFPASDPPSSTQCT